MKRILFAMAVLVCLTGCKKEETRSFIAVPPIIVKVPTSQQTIYQKDATGKAIPYQIYFQLWPDGRVSWIPGKNLVTGEDVYN